MSRKARALGVDRIVYDSEVVDVGAVWGFAREMSQKGQSSDIMGWVALGPDIVRKRTGELGIAEDGSEEVRLRLYDVCEGVGESLVGWFVYQWIASSKIACSWRWADHSRETAN